MIHTTNLFAIGHSELILRLNALNDRLLIQLLEIVCGRFLSRPLAVGVVSVFFSVVAAAIALRLTEATA